jgi:hypothetical protein
MTNRERTPQHEVGESGSSGGIGMRDQISATIARARAAIRLSRERAERSRAIVDVSGFVVEEAQRATDASRRIRAELRESVVAYVRDLRAQGVPSERMLVLVKVAVREATPPELDAYEARALMEDVVRWSVDAYYHAA